jgi:N-methylhydantoinase A/oxoprolinase/acetone carboxylase beta subunit
MLIGIDVGGTTTDAVLTEGRTVLAAAAVATVPDDVAGSVLGALDGVLTQAKPAAIERVVLSTTVITNLLAENKADRVGLVLIPGPGVDPSDYELPPAYVVNGAIDYRGREVAPLNERELRQVAKRLVVDGNRKVALVGKFCQRNPAHELAAKAILEAVSANDDGTGLVTDEPACLEVECGHRVSGRLNFPRRAATTLLTLATRDRYREFATGMSGALRQRGIDAPVFVLKADGGTLPLEYSLRKPVETIFSGPAASTMGALALAPQGESFVVLDVGGTTTDLALVLDGRPLLSSKGARVGGLLTDVRAFAVKSVPVGGDSAVRVVDGKLAVGPDRAGPPVCLGGAVPTPTDAMRACGLTDLGDGEAAQRAMAGVAAAMGVSLAEAAAMVMDMGVDTIVREVEDMFQQWRNEPVYRVWEVVREQHARPDLLLGVGGAASWLAPAVAQRLGVRCLVPRDAPVANALGAALARPTLTLTLRADTSEGTWATEEGDGGSLADTHLRLDGAENMALRLLAQKAVAAGISDYAGEAEITHSEVFNMVRGGVTVGRLLSATAEIPAGLLSSWSGAHDL